MMNKLSNKRILVTGASGRVGTPMCERLVADNNEVWGICRFSRPGTQERLDKMGVETRQVELFNPDFSQLPEYFDHIIHLGAAVIEYDEQGEIQLSSGPSFDRANEVNGIGTGQLMSHFRDAKSMLMTSTTGVYKTSQTDEEHLTLLKEEDPLGIAVAPVPQYSISKQGQEVVTRFCAQEFGLPTTIARLGVATTPERRSYSEVFLTLLQNDLPVPVVPADKSRNLWSQFIHDDDLYAHLPGLLDIASTNAPILNWTGTEVVTMVDVVKHIAARMGVEPKFAEDTSGLYGPLVDTTKLVEMVGPCQYGWQETWDKVLDVLLPDCPRL